MTGPARSDGARARTILLVEDDAAVREYLTARLEMLGYTLTAAKSGTEALQLLRQGIDVDLLFTDIVMPGGISGIDLAEIVERDFPDIRIVLTSGYAGTDVFRGVRLSPNIALLSKPLRGKDLGAKLEEVFASG